jgi:hypothetical protein
VIASAALDFVEGLATDDEKTTQEPPDVRKMTTGPNVLSMADA